MYHRIKSLCEWIAEMVLSHSLLRIKTNKKLSIFMTAHFLQRYAIKLEDIGYTCLVTITCFIHAKKQRSGFLGFFPND